MMGIEEMEYYIIENYGNVILHDNPEFNKRSKLWISRLRSDYPIMISDDRRDVRDLRFIKMRTLGYVVFSKDFRLISDKTSTDDDVNKRIDEYLDMWRRYAEDLVVSATAEKIAHLPEVAHTLNPVCEIVNVVIEDCSVNFDQYVENKSSNVGKMNRYFSLLTDIGILRNNEGIYTEGDLLVTLRKEFEDKSFSEMMIPIYWNILKNRYTYLRHVIKLTSLERLINVENIVYYPEIHMRDEVPRDRKTIVKEYLLEYGKEMPASAMSLNLRKLRDIGVIERKDSLYHGTNDLRNKIFELQKVIKSPESAWVLPSPI